MAFVNKLITFVVIFRFQFRFLCSTYIVYCTVFVFTSYNNCWALCPKYMCSWVYPEVQVCGCCDWLHDGNVNGSRIDFAIRTNDLHLYCLCHCRKAHNQHHSRCRIGSEKCSRILIYGRHSWKNSVTYCNAAIAAAFRSRYLKIASKQISTIFFLTGAGIFQSAHAVGACTQTQSSARIQREKKTFSSIA